MGSHQDVLYVEPFFIFINDIQERNPSYHHLNLNVCYADDYFLTLSAIDNPATLKEELNLSNRPIPLVFISGYANNGKKFSNAFIK